MEPPGIASDLPAPFPGPAAGAKAQSEGSEGREDPGAGGWRAVYKTAMVVGEGDDSGRLSGGGKG